MRWKWTAVASSSAALRRRSAGPDSGQKCLGVACRSQNEAALVRVPPSPWCQVENVLLVADFRVHLSQPIDTILARVPAVISASEAPIVQGSSLRVSTDKTLEARHDEVSGPTSSFQSSEATRLRTDGLLVCIQPGSNLSVVRQTHDRSRTSRNTESLTKLTKCMG